MITIFIIVKIKINKESRASKGKWKLIYCIQGCFKGMIPDVAPLCQSHEAVAPSSSFPSECRKISSVTPGNGCYFRSIILK